MTYEEEHDEMIDVTEAMLKWGGGFVKALAQAMRIADDDNLKKLKDAFPEYWKQYKEMAK